jgi:hypothetical protein
LDVWQVTSTHIDIYSPPSAPLLPLTFCNHTHAKTIIPLPETLTPVSRTDWNLTSLENSTFHSAYHPLFEIDHFMTEIAGLYPDIVTLQLLGQSGEGRPMWGLSISRKDGVVGAREKRMTKFGFLITGAQHAREVSIKFRILLPSLQAAIVGRYSCFAVLGPCTRIRRLRAPFSDPSSRLLRKRAMVIFIRFCNIYSNRTGFLHCTIPKSRWLCLYLGTRSVLVSVLSQFRGHGADGVIGIKTEWCLVPTLNVWDWI